MGRPWSLVVRRWSLVVGRSPWAAGCHIVGRVLSRDAAERAVERREVPEAGEGERHEEAVIPRQSGVRTAGIVCRVVFERDAAALGVVEPCHPLVSDEFLVYVVVHGVRTAETVVSGVRRRRYVQRLIAELRIAQSGQRVDKCALAPR